MYIDSARQLSPKSLDIIKKQIDSLLKTQEPFGMNQIPSRDIEQLKKLVEEASYNGSIKIDISYITEVEFSVCYGEIDECYSDDHLEDKVYDTAIKSPQVKAILKRCNQANDELDKMVTALSKKYNIDEFDIRCVIE